MLMECPCYSHERDSFFDDVGLFSILYYARLKSTFTQLMHCMYGDTELSKSVCMYVNSCFKKREEMLHKNN